MNPLPTGPPPLAAASLPLLTRPNPLPTRALDPESPPSDTSPSAVTFTPGAPPPPIPDWTAEIPHGEGKDEYVMYMGNGSVAAGWPSRAEWMTYEDMYSRLFPRRLPPHFPFFSFLPIQQCFPNPTLRALAHPPLFHIPACRN